MKGFMVVANLILAMVLVSGAAMNTAEAHPRVFAHSHHKHVVVKKEVVVRPAPVRNLVSYAIGSAFDTIPSGHVHVVHGGRNYYVHDGVFFNRVGNRYVVMKPVAGVRVATLPRGFTTVRIDGRTLYRFNDVTYRRVNNYYIVV